MTHHHIFSRRPLLPVLMAIALALLPRYGQAQTQAVDSTAKTSPIVRIAGIGVPLIAEGLLVKGEDKGFRQLRNHYASDFHSSFDNYLRYLPAAVLLGMKVGGVESRSSWGRMLTSDAFSTAIMGAAVFSVKHIVHRTRPDGSDRESFPSGHTAAAFMTATMLNKEYGHLSPWVGIGAYTVATGTAVMRMANNKHWFSDIITGAGIGIISTEMGYYLADLIFKDRGITQHPDTELFYRDDRPSFAGVYVGFGLPLSDYRMKNGATYNTTTGNTIGAEAAWFFNPYLGIGGRFLLSNTGLMTGDDTAENSYLDYYSITAGPYFSYPLTSRLLLGSHLVAGQAHYGSLSVEGLTQPAANRFTAGTGCSIAFRAHRHFTFRLFLDYNLYGPQDHGGPWLHTLTPGTSFAATL